MSKETANGDSESAEFVMLERLTELKNHQDEIGDEIKRLERRVEESTKKADIGIHALQLQQKQWQIFQAFALLMLCIGSILCFDYLTSGTESSTAHYALVILNNSMISCAVVIGFSRILCLLAELHSIQGKVDADLRRISGAADSSKYEQLDFDTLTEFIGPEQLVAGGDGFHVDNPESDEASGDSMHSSNSSNSESADSSDSEDQSETQSDADNE